MRRISARVENTIKNICRVKVTYTCIDIERALESRQRTREKYQKYGVRRPTSREVQDILAKAQWHIVIEQGTKHRATKYRWSDKDDGKE